MSTLISLTGTIQTNFGSQSNNIKVQANGNGFVKVLRQGVSLTRNSQIQREWLGNELQESTCLHRAGSPSSSMDLGI